MTSEDAYLVGLRLAGKKVVVVGGGSVAQRRLPLLIASGADVHVVSPSVTPAVEAMSGVTVTLRPFEDADLDDAWYVIAATDDPDVNAAVVAGPNVAASSVSAPTPPARAPRSPPPPSSTKACPSGCWPAGSTGARPRSGRPSTKRSSRG
ncbi:hypothetical protein MAGR_11230 [Mycolicibacterium agri]|uniref:precorrin-2 dehydrogenase n=1 Tax=Mycolicibacterium agri TaxID=36811 RepID=A0A7I9VW68_MYCAG|nr:hypothetical protein MAGR_11230 [Mycolicibacterium agri]